MICFGTFFRGLPDYSIFGAYLCSRKDILQYPDVRNISYICSAWRQADIFDGSDNFLLCRKSGKFHENKEKHRHPSPYEQRSFSGSCHNGAGYCFICSRAYRSLRRNKPKTRTFYVRDMNTTIQKHLEEIDASIREVANKDPLADYVDPIYDGVADLERYLHAQPRVMWLMKEPYDSTDENGNPFGGGWRLTDCFRKDDVLNCRSWHPIIYVMYGIINGCKWDDMDWIRDDKSRVTCKSLCL